MRLQSAGPCAAVLLAILFVACDFEIPKHERETYGLTEAEYDRAQAAVRRVRAGDVRLGEGDIPPLVLALAIDYTYDHSPSGPQDLAIRGLVEIGSAAVPALEAAVKGGKTPLIRKRAVEALERISIKGPDPDFGSMAVEDAIRPMLLRYVYAGANTRDERRAAILAYGEEARPALEEAAADASVTDAYRQAARRLLQVLE